MLQQTKKIHLDHRWDKLPEEAPKLILISTSFKVWSLKFGVSKLVKIAVELNTTTSNQMRLEIK